MRSITPKVVFFSLFLVGLFGLSARAQTSVVYADPLGNPNAITILYSAPMLQSSATSLANYSLVNSGNSTVVPINTATLKADQMTVQLQLGAALQLYSNYTFSISGVKDAALGFISPNPTIVSFWFGGNPNLPTYTFDDGRIPSTTWLSSNAVDTAGNGKNPYLSVTNVGGVNNSGMLILTANTGGGTGHGGGVPNGQAFAQWHIADLVNGAAITNLILAFDMFYGNGSGGNTPSYYTDTAHAGGNGLLFHWGPGLNPNGVDQYTGGASSWGTGLDVTFRIYNSSPNIPGISIYYGGTAGAGNNSPVANKPYLDYFTGNFVNTWPNNTSDPTQIGFSSNYTHVVVSILVTNSATATNAVISLSCSNAWNGLTNIYSSQVIPNFTMPRATQPMAFTATDGAGGHADGFLDNVDFTINGAHIIGSAPVGPVGIRSQPASQTVAENVHATFNVGVAGAPPITFQWYSNSVAIPSATNASYTTPLTLYSTMNGTTYYVAVSNDFSYSISSNATLTIIKDTNGVQVASVGSLDGNTIGVTFSGYVDLPTAGNTANYVVNGGAVAVMSADTRTSLANFGNPEVNYTPSYLKTVRLSLGSTVSSGFTVTIKSNLLSRTGLQVNWNNAQQRGSDTNLVGQVLGVSDADLGSPGGDPLAYGQGFSGGSNLVQLFGGGSNLMPIGGAGTDAGNFAYTARSGNFDVMASLFFETPTAATTKAGLMVRPNPTDATSPAIAIKCFPQTGNNYFDTPYRAIGGTASVTWNAVGTPANGNQAAFWSGTGQNWIRIRSLGGTYYGYVSSNGSAWILLGQVTPNTNSFPYPSTESVGLFVCAANNDGRYCEADFSNWGAVTFSNAVLALTTNLPTSITTTANFQATFSIAATLTGPAANELVYQWQRAEPSSPTVFNDTYAANANTYTTPFLSVADNGAKYRVIAYAGDISTGRSTNSATVTLTVNPDTVPPFMVSAIADATFQQVTINFNKPMDGPNGPSGNNTLGNLANYALVNATNAGNVIMINNVTPVSNDGGAHYLSVQLALGSPLLPGVPYTLTVHNVLDASMNNINNTVVPGGKQRLVTGWVLAYGYLKYERYQGPLYPNGNGTYTGTLEGSPGGLLYPNSLENAKLTANTPDNTQLITISGFPSGANFTSPGITTAGDVFDFGARITGFFIPPTNGTYQFYVRGNDGTALWVSSDSTIPDPNAVLAHSADNETFGSGHSFLFSITNITAGYVNIGFYDPTPITMTGGQPYGLVAMDQQANGGSCIEFSWGFPGASTLWDGTSVTASLDTNYRTYAGMVTNSYNIRGSNIATYVNPDMSTLTATGPTNTTITAGLTATFSVSAAGTLSLGSASYPEPLAYQWLRSGTNIPGATRSSYTTPVLVQADSNATFSVVVTMPGASFLGVTNSAVVSVLAPLSIQVVSASGFGSSIGIQFNQAMDPVSVANAANYTAVSGGLTVTSVQLQPDGRTVALKLSSNLTPPTFSVTLNNVKGLGGNSIAANTVVTGNVPFPQLTAVDIGVGTNAAPPGVLQTNASLPLVTFDVNFPGSALMATDGVFQVQASGNDIGTNQDGFHYIYEQRTGDFDVMVHLERIDGSDARSKAGLMVRESLTPGARNYALVVEPAGTNALDGTGAGFNGVEMLRRTNANNTLSAFPTINQGNSINNGPNPPVLRTSAGATYDSTGLTNMYPIWLRLRLSGTNLYFYTGADGTNWYLCGREKGLPAGWPATAYLGMATTARTNNIYTRSQFSRYGNFVAPAKKQVLMLCGGDVGGTGNQIGLVNGGSYGSPSALSTPAGNPNGPALWVGSSTYLYNLFLSLGYSITVVHPATSQTEDGYDKTLVIWGGDCQSGDTSSNGKWVALPVPEISWKYSSYEKNYWLSTSSDRSNPGGLTSLMIVNTNNPIVKGAYALNATVPVVTSGQFFSYGISNDLANAGSGFTVVGVDPASPTHALLFYADVGAKLYASSSGAAPTANSYATTMPARRVGLWMGDNSSAPVGDWSQSTTDGLFLLTNSINWATAITTNPPSLSGPTSQAVTPGQTATFAVVATGPGPLTYQWRTNGTPIAGATSVYYTTPTMTLADSGKQFTVVVTGLYGSTTSAVANLTVQTPVGIAAQPQNQTAFTGSTATFSVTATGSSPTYQWYSNNVSIAGAIAATYTTAPLTTAANGAQYYVQVSNLISTTNSAPATLTVLAQTQSGINGFTRIDSTHFSINWSNGTATSVLLSSTNVAQGITNWTPVVTNPTLPYTIIVDPNTPRSFYRVKQ
jgi:hypothetical protein